MSVEEVKGDLFLCFDENLCEPEKLAICHCVSEDFVMGKGIAVMFKNKFGRVDELLSQNKKVGECASLTAGSSTVYYLVTKKVYNGKPTYETLRKSLMDMKNDCLKKGIQLVCMPRIGWESVKKLLSEVFENSEIQIRVYYL
jgi:hypothetical protein